MSPFNRREFLKTSIAAGTLASVGTSPLHAAPPSATDLVTLGKCGLKVSRLAFGTGTNNGTVQAALGQQEFNRLIHYAYDRGIRFFETAEAYETPAMLGEALKPFPRESYQLMTKVTTDTGVDPQKAGRRPPGAIEEARHRPRSLRARPARVAPDARQRLA
jgi:aryl-alcohol dehydrogenase-like predicted oxidoreductase